MKNRTAVVLGTCFILLAPAAQAAPQVGTDTATYANVELVAIDPARRVVVIRDAKGARLTYDMDDLFAGTASVKPGDRVIVTVRGGSGPRRISAITKAAAVPGTVTVASSAPLASAATNQDPSVATVKAAFARQVASLSEDARPIDALWSSFVTSCKLVKPVTTDGGRAWFGLWDGRVDADYTIGQCRDIFNQMVSQGELIKKGMSAAEEVARRTLTPGDIRDIRKVNLMDWDGWSLPAPQKRDP